ncbi:M23 family metallopeptidase [Marinisporobacter balticus]|uniref:Peptidase M23-like protein n=1 Tax=Marinisporobacter balticus TaxID=2018667 RepID=A0A4R2L7Z6_9FIRM|nr:M23 family metallopeptidase [Marinisporobacter balticus]TCO78808.1 peptidase M23-like protein [Marinisporobacter balticus]
MRLKKWVSKHKSIYKLIDKEGFYIILFLCVCIVAITATWVAKKNIDKIATQDFKIPSLEENKRNIHPFPLAENITEQPVIVVEDIKENEVLTDIVVNEAPKVKAQKVKATPIKDIVKEKKENIKKEMKMPVNGNIGMNYGKDTLIYSKTLDQYTTHYGIDIIAPESTPVTAVLAGEVVEVSNDPKLGIIISLSHNGNMISRYANLSTHDLVKVGDWVAEGQKISEIGKSALFEILEESHLHFEVLIDGKNVDPNQFLYK